MSRRRRVQGIAVGNYSFTLDALTLKPFDFSNVGVCSCLFVLFIRNIDRIQWFFWVHLRTCPLHPKPYSLHFSPFDVCLSPFAFL